MIPGAATADGVPNPVDVIPAGVVEELAEREPGAVSLQRLAKALGVPVAELLG